jgi:hypothetical protein
MSLATEGFADGGVTGVAALATVGSFESIAVQVK